MKNAFVEGIGTKRDVTETASSNGARGREARHCLHSFLHFDQAFLQSRVTLCLGRVPTELCCAVAVIVIVAISSSDVGHKDELKIAQIR
jgi:hypothetical protein